MSLGPWEIALIMVGVIILFGGNKLPELARGLGLGLKEFNKTIREIKNEVTSATEEVENEGKEIKE